MKKCIGCGATLQCIDELKEGYINEKLIDRENAYCLRCHRLRNYNENKEVLKEDYIKILSKICNEDALIVHIVDLFDFSNTFLPQIKRLTGQNDCIICANKRDLLPKSVKDNKIINFVRHMANLDDFKALDVILTSAKTLDNITDLVESIIKYAKGRKVYFVGCANVGKSSIINAILKKYSDERKDVITTSNIPGTTLGFIEIHLENFSFIDTPGVFNERQIVNNLSSESMNKIMPKKEIKPINLQLDSKQTVFISGLARFDFVDGDRTNFTFYFSNDLLIHRTKLENADNLFARQISELLNPPTKEEYGNLTYYSRVLNFDGEKKMDLVLSGLGFITIKDKCKIKITTVEGVIIYTREALI